MAFGFKLLQRDVSAPDFDPDLLNDPGDVENYNTRIELVQPIINVDGWQERKAANLQLEISNLQYERNMEYLELEVTKTYMQLQLAHKALVVLEKARETALENKKQAKNNLKQGLIQNADYMNVSQVANVSEYLSFLTGEESGATLVPQSELIQTTYQYDEATGLNTQRKDIRATVIATEAQKKMFSSSKMSFVPKANAMASYGWNDSELFGFGADNYVVGIQLSWDLFGGYKNIGKIHKERAMLDKASLQQKKYLDKSEIELNKAKRQYIDAKNNISLTSLAMEQSREALRITTNRFQQGLEKTTELLFAETQFLEKEMSFYESVFNFNYSQAHLEFLTK